MFSLHGFQLCQSHTQTHTSKIKSVEAGLACCLNQGHVASCRSVITSKCKIITEENSREEECHVPRCRVSLILRFYIIYIQLILLTSMTTGNW